MTPPTPQKPIRRPAKQINWEKIVDILYEEGIIYTNFTGRLAIDFNRGGISACETTNKLK